MLALSFFTALSGCDSETTPETSSSLEHPLTRDERAGEEIRFGLYESEKASKLYRRFAPLIDELERAINSRSASPIRIEIKIFDAYDKAISSVAEGRVDFARFGAASYVQVKKLDPTVEILVIEQKEGRTTFNGMFIVREDSPIREIEDLKGRRVAFGSRRSTIGRFLAQALMARHGVYASDLAGFDYLDRHDKVLKAVQIGDYDAGPIKESTFGSARPRDGLRVLHEFTLITKPWIARGGLPAELVTLLRETLLDLEDREALAALGLSGFERSDDASFQAIRTAIEESIEFER